MTMSGINKVMMVESAIILHILFVFLVTDGKLFGIPASLGMPWYRILDHGFDYFPVDVAWNISIFFVWGMFHSAAAQPPVQACVARWTGGLIPAPLVFLTDSAMTALVVMAFWQPVSGFVVWDVNPFPQYWRPFPTSAPELVFSTYDIVSVISFMAAMNQFGTLMTQLSGRTVEESKDKVFAKKALVTKGWYGIVRHPLYTTMFIMLSFTFRMDLARITILLAHFVYLVPGVYWEERRLEEEFGADVYGNYRKKVPSKFIPFLY